MDSRKQAGVMFTDKGPERKFKPRYNSPAQTAVGLCLARQYPLLSVFPHTGLVLPSTVEENLTSMDEE